MHSFLPTGYLPTGLIIRSYVLRTKRLYHAHATYSVDDVRLKKRCYIMKGLHRIPGRIAQSVTCLAKDASLTADPGVVSLIRAPSHTFVEIDYEIISMVILLPSAESFKKDCCQLQAKVCAQSTG